MSQPSTFDAQTAIAYIIAAGGNSKLAAVRLSKELYNDANQVSEATLLTTIAHDPSSLTTLTSQIRLLAILQAVDAFRLTHQAYLEKLPQLSPRDTAKAYTDLLDNMASLGQGAALTPTDPYEAILRALPPEVSSAVRALVMDKAPPPPPATDAVSILNRPEPPNNLNQKQQEGYAPHPTRADDDTPETTEAEWLDYRDKLGSDDSTDTN